VSDVRLILGDCMDVLPTLESGSVDAVVTDPPAGIGFMGKEWDDFRRSRNANDTERDNQFGRLSAHGPEYARRDRDTFVAFLSAVMRECFRLLKPAHYGLVWAIPRTSHWTALALEEAGFEIRDRISHLFGTGFPKGKGCLKPACEDWWLVRKPGKGVLPLGIDECRIAVGDDEYAKNCSGDRGHASNRTRNAGFKIGCGRSSEGGRWPANVTHDGSDEVVVAFAEYGEKPGMSCGALNRGSTTGTSIGGHGRYGKATPQSVTADRFFYCAKASRSDRGEGNTHPTVKNTALMEWLIKLVAREGEAVLDPFLGSGSTAVACAKSGRKCIGVEKEAEYHAIAERRIAAARAEKPLFA
jgi:site-specific DNA-methyltransferase (adenine-specific)